jgi:glycosyltransferase involved in cell wall biosynthesis
MAQLGDIDVSLDIVGDGFDRVACEELVGTLELSDRVNFHGVVRRDAVDGFYKSADIFVFPSYREPGGNVPFEAMSYGLPMIVSDRGGPGYVVTDSCGIRIAPRNPDDFAADIARAIRELWKDPERRILMGECARERVRDIGTWDLRIAQIDRVYECLGGAGTDRS